MKSMRTQAGSVALWVSLTVTIVLLIGAAVFAVWAYQGRQKYKNDTDQIVASAVQQAKQQQAATLNKAFAEKYKQPLTTYKGPSAYGSIRLKYPKTWSGYVAVSSDSDPLVDGYWAPGVVPSVEGEGSVFALRMQVVAEPYSQVMEEFRDNVEQGKAKVRPYSLPKVKDVVGSKVTGELTIYNGSNPVTGTMIVLPMRANTLEIWAASGKYQHDLNEYILPNLTFSP